MTLPRSQVRGRVELGIIFAIWFIEITKINNSAVEAIKHDLKKETHL